MHRNPGRFFAILLILGSLLACALPGLGAPVPVNTLDPNSLSTAIAGTSAALAVQTSLAAPATPDLPPAPTQTTPPTITATATPQISSEGTSLGKQSDGSLVFSDYSGGYSVVVPAGWLALRINEKEFINAWSLPEASDPLVQNMLTQYQKSDPKAFRLFGIDIQPDHLRPDFRTNFNIFWDRSNKDTIEQQIAKLRKNPPITFAESKVTFAGTRATSTGIPMGIIEYSTSLTTLSGQSLTIYQKQALFNGQTGLLAFTLTTVADQKDEIEPGFSSMVDGIKILPQQP